MTSRSHISVILDRTGFMQDIREDAVGGFNAFLAQQQAAPDPATFTLVQFDSQESYEVLHSAVVIDSVPPLTLEQYVPRATTPLYDAMGRGILELEVLLLKCLLDGGPYDTHVHMLRHQMPFQNLTAALLRQVMEHLAKMASELAENSLLTPLQDLHHGVLEVPARMSEALILFYCESSSLGRDFRFTTTVV